MRLLFLLALAIYADVYGDILPCCPTGWTLYPEPDDETYIKCIKAIKNWNAKFSDMESECAAIGGRPVSIQSRMQNIVVRAVVRALPDSLPYYVYIGMTNAGKMKENKEFFWVDGSKVNYTNWMTGYPREGDGGCVTMLMKTGVRGSSEIGVWIDVPCDTTAPYVCETLACSCERSC